MRIDKFLWCIRVYKTRTDASQAIRLGRIEVNGQPVKPAREVAPGDAVSIRRAAITLTLRVKLLPKGRLGAKIVPEYVDDCTPQSELDKMRLRLMQPPTMMRAPGSGRPTKKERRDMEEVLNPEEADSQALPDDLLGDEDTLALEDEEAINEWLHRMHN